MDELYAKESSGAEDVAKKMLREHFEASGIEWDGEV